MSKAVYRNNVIPLRLAASPELSDLNPFIDNDIDEKIIHQPNILIAEKVATVYENLGALSQPGAKMSDVSREEIDAKIAASEARTEIKITRLEGKLDLVLAKIDSVREENNHQFSSAKDDSRAIRANQWVIAFGLAVLIVAVVALFPVFFGIGVQIKDIVAHEVASQTVPPRK
jgi:hypothetical protein